MRSALLLDLPLTEYRAALELQRRCVAARQAGRISHDLAILLEHPPVFTLGRRGGRDNLLADEAELDRRGIAIVPIERGGDITYHGPGQLVAYLIMNLNAAHFGVRELVAALETVMVNTAADWGVRAAGNPTYRGAWVGSRKLGSIGITVRRGITFHGLAFNVSTDLTPFTWINPCGIAGCTMTTLQRETGVAPDMVMARQRLATHLGMELELDFRPAEIREIEKALN